MTMFLLKMATVTLTLALETSYSRLVQDIVILPICRRLNQNRSINEGARAITMFFSKYCDPDLGHGTLKLKLV